MPQQKAPTRTEVLIAGLGGMGVLVAGQVLLEAAARLHEHVSYISSYGFARRGGLCECTVIFSDNKIASPLLDHSQTIMILDSSQFRSFEHRVRPGGVIITEKAGLTPERGRDDYNLKAIPGLEMAVSMGSTVINNLILLGSYITITGAVPPAGIERELQKRYADNEKLMERNLEAFRRGLELGKDYA
ncbi:MAG: 2-oxoacid:acceptor oxidoreductase family protein [Dehalococcoidia bacterium]|nr:2-oxoacid:acceptor oxidoreductase family protein [Dehalococcoidia bacterium]